MALLPAVREGLDHIVLDEDDNRSDLRLITGSGDETVKVCHGCYERRRLLADVSLFAFSFGDVVHMVLPSYTHSIAAMVQYWR